MAKKTLLGERLRVNKSKKDIDSLIGKLHPEEDTIPPSEEVTKVEIKEETSESSEVVQVTKSLPVTKEKEVKSVKKKKTEKEEEMVSTSMKYPKSLFIKMKVHCAQNETTIRDYLIKLVAKDLKKK